MKRLVQAWEAYWFPTTSAVRLGVLRIVFVALQLAWLMDPLSLQLSFLEADGFSHPQAPIRALVAIFGEEAIRTPAVIAGLWWGTVIAGLFALVGLFAQPMMLLFGVGCLLQIAHRYSYGEVHHVEALFLVTLVLMGLSPCGKALSLDAVLRRRRDSLASPWGLDAPTTHGMWAIRLAQWLLCIAYFEAFLSKITVGGLHWMNGYTLQNYLLQDGIWRDRPLGLWLCQSRLLCIGLAVWTLWLEGTFFVVMFDRPRRVMRWVRTMYFFFGLCLHIGIYLTQAAPFFEFMILYLLWAPWEKLIRPAASSLPRDPAPSPPPPLQPLAA